MEDDVKSVVTQHPGLSEVGVWYCAHGLPCMFSKTIGGLTPSWGTNNIGLVSVDLATDADIEELMVAITAELLGKAAGVGAEELKSFDKALGDKGFDAIELDVLGRAVNREKGVSKAELAGDVTINSVNMNLVEEVRGGREYLAMFAFLEVRKLTH